MIDVWIDVCVPSWFQVTNLRLTYALHDRMHPYHLILSFASHLYHTHDKSFLNHPINHSWSLDNDANDVWIIVIVMVMVIVSYNNGFEFTPTRATTGGSGALFFFLAHIDVANIIHYKHRVSDDARMDNHDMILNLSTNARPHNTSNNESNEGHLATSWIHARHIHVHVTYYGGRKRGRIWG